MKKKKKQKVNKLLLGLEPKTLRLLSACSSQLSYRSSCWRPVKNICIYMSCLRGGYSNHEFVLVNCWTLLFILFISAALATTKSNQFATTNLSKWVSSAAIWTPTLCRRSCACARASFPNCTSCTRQGCQTMRGKSTRKNSVICYGRRTCMCQVLVTLVVINFWCILVPQMWTW